MKFCLMVLCSVVVLCQKVDTNGMTCDCGECVSMCGSGIPPGCGVVVGELVVEVKVRLGLGV